VTADAPGLARALRDPEQSAVEVSRLVARLSAGEQAGTESTWIAAATDDGLEDWRRVAAAQILVEHCTPYPQPLRRLLAEVLAPIGADPGALQDMTMAQNLPIPRIPGESVRMASLPLSTRVGPAAVYIGMTAADDMAQRAAVFPRVEQLTE
jgi:hypothetical protein